MLGEEGGRRRREKEEETKEEETKEEETKVKKERRVGRVSKHSLVYSTEVLKSGFLTVNYTVVLN